MNCPLKFSHTFLPSFYPLHRSVGTSAHVSLCDTVSNNRHRFFRSYIWEPILAYGSGKQGDKELAMELIRQLEVVTIRDPSLVDRLQ